MRLSWVFLRYRDKKDYTNKEVRWKANACGVRFVHGIPSDDASPRIVVYFGSYSLNQGLPIETHVRSIMNGLQNHLEHCTNPVMFTKHYERYAHNSGNSNVVPSALCKGDTLAIRNVFARVSTLYLHVHSDRDLKAALTWLRRAMPLLRDIQDDSVIYVCHPANPDAVVGAMKHDDEMAAKKRKGDPPFGKVGILSSIQAWDVRFRKYRPYQVVPWQTEAWWNACSSAISTNQDALASVAGM